MDFKKLKESVSNRDYIYNEKVLPTSTSWEDVYESFLKDTIQAITNTTACDYMSSFELYRITKNIIKDLGIALDMNSIDSQMKIVNALEDICSLTDL